MKVRITRELLRDVKPTGKVWEIADTEVRGFIARVSSIGTIIYGIRYSTKEGRPARYSIGKGFPITSVSDAREEARILLGRIAAGDSPADEKKAARLAKLTLRDFIDGDYGAHLRSKTRTAEEVISRLKRCFSTLLERPFSDIDAISIDRWRATRVKSGTSASTVNRDIAALKPLFSRAVEWNILADNPLKFIKPIKSDADPIVRYLDAEEEKRLRKALDARDERERLSRESANHWRAQRKYPLLAPMAHNEYCDYLTPAVLLSINTGLRQGELINLMWPDVNLGKDPYVFVRGETAKSKKGRHVPLNDEAVEVLKRWESQSSGGASKGLVFPGKDGKPKAEVKTAWGKLLAAAEIEDFRWHDMRHHFASRLVMAGVDLNTVRELLGHSDLKMTLRYAHLAPEHKAAAVQKLMKGK
jgi:integrase